MKKINNCKNQSYNNLAIHTKKKKNDLLDVELKMSFLVIFFSSYRRKKKSLTTPGKNRTSKDEFMTR